MNQQFLKVLLRAVIEDSRAGEAEEKLAQEGALESVIWTFNILLTV